MNNDAYDDPLKGLSERLLELENRPRTAEDDAWYNAEEAYLKKFGEKVPLGPEYLDLTLEMINKAISDNEKIKPFELPLDAES
ncbi:MAG: hypothetical protein RIR39_1530 [Pseudomonadota bacterium]|jgi:hypothetical protein